MTGLPPARTVRSASFVLALAVLPVIGLAQPAPPPGPPMPPDPLGATPESEIFPKSDDLARQIQQTAPDYIKAKDWVTVAQVLQAVIDQPGDFLLKTEVKGPGGKTTVRYVSGRAEAERLLVTLPKAGLAAYRLKYGGPSQIMLAQARNNPALLDEVARRYFLTDSGAEALARMGVYELDRGRAEEAADRFRRLLQRPDADELPPLTLFQSALAFHAANDPVREAQALQLLGRRLGPAGLNIGGQNLSLEDLRKEVVRWPATPVASGDWPMFRGDPRRTGRAEADFPLLEARDAIPIPVYDEAAKTLAPPPDQAPAGGGHALPGGVPLAVAGKVIYRGPDGLHALDADTGREVWHYASPLCLAKMLEDDNKKGQLLAQWLPKYRGMPTLIEENATLGTLSSDGRHVFFVEDVPVPAHPSDLLLLQQPQGVGRPWFSSLEGNLYHNRLAAVDALTGAPKWEVGGWDKDANPPRPEFANVFFLGPPLPVGRRLFVLVEQTLPVLKRNRDVVLLCLDPETGRLIWSQDLAVSQESLSLDPARRMQPAHLAYADGVLVCPANNGAVVAVDPLTHNLLWAQLYRDRVNNPADGGVPTFNPDQYESGWRGCAPIVHGDRVVLTAPDGDSVRCINIKDGTVLWNALRTDEDLYVAGVFGDKTSGERVVIVGKTTCRAVSLDKGEEVWKDVATGEPSGLGAESGTHYLIPLRKGGIFVLDTANPNASTQIEGKPDQVPGNLVFHGGDLWSQSMTAVTAYPQLGKGLERAEARVAKNPKDPLARIDRGRLYYSKGDAARAVQDWLAALDDNPPADLAAQTQDRLFGALTQLLQQDFAANEKYMGQYEKLCKRPPPPGAAPEQVQEQRRRLLHLLVITARGREAQGRIDQALQAYVDLYETAGPAERMAAPEDASVQVRVDLWVQGRIADLARRTAPEKQQALKDRIDRDWRAAQAAGDPPVLTRFIALYGAVPGPLGAPGRDARLMLAERWLDDRDRRHAFDAELQLQYLRAQADAPETAARAQYALARLLTRHGLLADAVEAYRALARDFPAVVVQEGKTGAALLADLAADKRFVAYLDDPLAGRPAGKVKFIELQERSTPKGAELACEPADGTPPPSCRNVRFTLDSETFALKVAGADGISESWSAPLPLPADYLHQLIAQWANQGEQLVPTYQAAGHFLVVSVGPLIVGVDRLEHRARWVRSLLPADLPAGVQIMSIAPGGADGTVWVQTSDGRPNAHLGVLGPAGPNGVVIQTRSGVADLDLSTGEVRWLRADASAMLSGFGDEEHLYLVAQHAAGDVYAVRSLRTADGVAVPIADCIEVYKNRVRNLGRCLLSSESAENGPLVFRYYDVQTGKDLWKEAFPANSVVLESAAPELAAVAAPDGTVTVVDLAARKELVKLKVEKKHLDKLVRGMLLRDRTQYYLALQGPPAPNTQVLGDPGVNFSGPMKWTQVNGMIYAFDRATGELHWNSWVESQVLLLDHFEESPVLLLTAVQQRQMPGAPAGSAVAATCTRSIDKATGKVLYRKEVNNNSDPFYSLEVDARTGTVDLVNSALRLRHTIEPAKGAGEHKGG